MESHLFKESNPAYRCGWYDAQEDIMFFLMKHDSDSIDRRTVLDFIMSREPKQKRRFYGE